MTAAINLALNSSPASLRADDPTGAIMRRPRVLVVDDDRFFLRQIEDLLEQEGFDTVVESSGLASIARIDSRSFDLVICDVLLDDVGSLAVVDRARRAKSKPAVLLVTSLSDDAEAVRELRSGGAQVLFKPLDPSELGHTIALLMHERHLRMQGLPASDLAVLYRVAAAVNSGTLTAPLFDRILNIALEALGGNAGSIMLASSGPTLPRTLTIASSYGLPFDSGRPSLEFGQGVAGWVAAHARPLRLVGRLDNYPQFRDLRSNPRCAESLVAPLVFRREVLGTISVNSSVEGRFGSEKLALLVNIAEVLAAALQRSRMERTREHQDRLAVLGQLSASIAHELNNPLAALLANASIIDTLLDQPDSPEARNDLKAMMRDVQEAAQRMRSLVGSLKGTARRPTDTLQEIDLDVLLCRAEVLVHPQFKHRVRLAVECGSPPRVKADSGRITQILINLLVNASQAVGKDGFVTIRSRGEGRWAHVEVQDNGPGIPDEVAAHLFEPFFTTKPEGEGTGLGLSISRQIAREYGGDLTFTSTVGEGTCFQLRLPIASEGEVTLPTLLLVDDEPALLNAAERVLRRDFTVLKASSPEDAVAKVTAVNVDLIVTDYSMPNQNGVSLVQQLRQTGVVAPAVLLTAVSAADDMDAAVASGLVLKVIPKPWNPATLGAELRQLLASNASKSQT